ncbi:MAG: hypothetical protein ACRD2B_05205 [Terriglobia bacterium]
MSETRPAAEMPPAAPPPEHETRDADIRKLVIMGISMAALIIGGFIATEIMFHYFVGPRPIKSPTTLFTRGQTPPAPLIQEHSGLELQQYLKQENHILDSYGWVDRKAGIVRIPIDRAMALLLQKGLPVRPPGQITRRVSAPVSIPRGDFGPLPQGVIPGPQPQ